MKLEGVHSKKTVYKNEQQKIIHWWEGLQVNGDRTKSRFYYKWILTKILFTNWTREHNLKFKWTQTQIWFQGEFPYGKNVKKCWQVMEVSRDSKITSWEKYAWQCWNFQTAED